MKTEVIDQIEPVEPYVAAHGFANRHVMTIAAAAWPRRVPHVVASQRNRLFPVSDCDSILVAGNDASVIRQVGRDSHCPDDSDRRPGRSVVLLVHGLEGCADSHYMLGLAYKCLFAGIDTVRVNLRNCGGTAGHCRTLYNAGMSGDIIALAEDLVANQGYEQVFLFGVSLGGNIVLKAACELGRAGVGYLAGVCAVSPSLDLSTCVAAMGSGVNRIYDLNFVFALKAKIREKVKYFPGLFDTELLKHVKTIRQFDDLFTAPDGGYDSAAHYYQEASAISMMQWSKAPILIITAKDDPIVPFASFQAKSLKGDNIKILAPDRGGHGGFLAARAGGSALCDRFWSEDQALQFFRDLA
ncbi:MAG: alpha/beta fold hydrolase [Candidatus Obscuribacterales bacterium]|nr:alpha/beta fold hydrolase [Candidatus Obscuribacterales bacterium]